MTLPTGANAQLISDLANNCAPLMINWEAAGTSDLSTQADRNYAMVWLLKNSGNSEPPNKINPDAILAGGDFRLFNDFQIGAAGVPIKHKAVVGSTPNPCHSIILPNSAAPEVPSVNGTVDTSPSGYKFQLAEGRLGNEGQAINLTLTGRSTPYIWTVVEFDTSYNPSWNIHSIFPTLYVYKDGTKVDSYIQNLNDFTQQNEFYSEDPNSIP